MLYKMKLVPEDGDGVPKKKRAKSEIVLRDLLTVMPTLTKHNLEGDIRKKIQKLRNGRKTTVYTLELMREFQGKELKVTAPLTKQGDKIGVLRALKQQIREQIQEARKSNRPPVEAYTFRQGVTVNKLAEVYLEPNTFVQVFKKKIRLDMTRGKKPNTQDNYIGVEIELASKRDRDFICDALFEAELGKYVTLKDDGSIKVDEVYPHRHEICVLVRQNEYVDVLTRLCKVLNEQCDVRVDASCGLHVHVDMRNRQVEKAFHNLVSCQQFLYAMLPAARRNSRFSYPVKGTRWRVLDERYHGINSQAYQKYGTLEARMHCGTTQGKKIVNWVKLLLSIVDAPLLASTPTSVESFQTGVGFDADLMTYVKARIAKFRSQHKNNVPQAEQPGTMPEVEELVGPAPADDTLVEQSEVA